MEKSNERTEIKEIRQAKIKLSQCRGWGEGCFKNVSVEVSWYLKNHRDKCSSRKSRALLRPAALAVDGFI